MPLLALIDGDLVGFRSAASCEPTKAKAEREPLEFAITRANECMQRILYATNASEYKLFIGGSDNFRYKIDPTYKANRLDKEKPPWLQPVREFLVTNWKAHITDGIEADDALGIEQCASHLSGETVIVSLDKDLLQIPGNHYNWVHEEWTHISPRMGWANFYTQLLMGDRSDNISGFDGKMRISVPKFLQSWVSRIHESCSTPWEMFGVVQEIYELGDEALLRNGNLLYIQRHEGDEWQFPVKEA
jgi:5'-3' exonuclease